MFHNILCFFGGLAALISFLGIFSFIAYIIGGGFKEVKKSSSAPVLDIDHVGSAKKEILEIQLELFVNDFFTRKPSF